METGWELIFTQAKATIQLPCPHEADRTNNIVNACRKAFKQLNSDIETFVELTEHFLTDDEF